MIVEHLKKLKPFWPFGGFVIAYTSLFYFLGHFDALDSIAANQLLFFGFNLTRNDVYFITISFIVLFIYMSVLLAYRVAQAKIFNFKEFALFTFVATVILPLSVWGLAWIQWFAIKNSGTLTLWEVGALKIAILWRSFMPLHIGLTLFFLIFTFFIILIKLYKNDLKF